MTDPVQSDCHVLLHTSEVDVMHGRAASVTKQVDRQRLIVFAFEKYIMWIEDSYSEVIVMLMIFSSVMMHVKIGNFRVWKLTR